jgi:hypothetical protein
MPEHNPETKISASGTYTVRYFHRCPEHSSGKRVAPADTGFLCDTADMLSARTKDSAVTTAL